MPLTLVSVDGHDFSRQIVRFTAFTGHENIACAVTYPAMDDDEKATGTTQVERDEQFERLKARIIEGAARKYFSGNLETSGDVTIMVKRADLAAVPKGLV